MTRTEDLTRIHEALLAAAQVVRPYTSGEVRFAVKAERGDPLTEADLVADRVLRDALLGGGEGGPDGGEDGSGDGVEDGRGDGRGDGSGDGSGDGGSDDGSDGGSGGRGDEGWLSEESVDDARRLTCRRVWVVDPIDGTREFVEGIPEWCISVGLVEDGLPVAGGILNPVTGELVIGSLETGVELNGRPVTVTDRPDLDGAVILASRSEIRRGEWERFRDAPFAVKPCGSVAYKLALVAAGLADGTWTLVPKSEWDVAAGTALIRAAGGAVVHADGSEPRFNQASPTYPNLLASNARLLQDFRDNWLHP